MAAGLHKKTVSTPNAYYPKRLMWSLDWTLYVRRSDRCQEDSVVWRRVSRASRKAFVYSDVNHILPMSLLCPSTQTMDYLDERELEGSLHPALGRRSCTLALAYKQGT